MREYQNCHHIFPLDLVGGKHFFRCDDGFHVPKLFVCDDEEDCYDGSDEKDCGEDCILPHFFLQDFKCNI